MTAKERETERMCRSCEKVKKLEDFGFYPDTCSVCISAELKELVDFRRQGTVGRSAYRLPIAEDLLTVVGSSIGQTVIRLLDSLAGLALSTSSGRAQNPDAIRHRSHHAPLPHFEPAWADHWQKTVDDQLWELTETLESFLNRPTDPKSQAGCTTCGSKRLGESAYCGTCGSRILDGARRCRVPGCPNNNGRRSACPKFLPTATDTIEHP